MASDGEKVGSVYDILYADVRRLSSLLSQFSEDGIVTELARTAEETAGTKVGLSVKIISAEASDGGRESATRKVDPQWLLPLMFLDEAQDLIQRDIAQASIGSLVLAQGRLVLTDLRILQQAWQAPALKAMMIREAKQQQGQEQAPLNRHERRAAAKKPPSEQASEIEMVLDLLPLLPHSPQVNIVNDDHAAWATIEPSSLVGTVEDLMLKHGAKVAGSWSMVGILDARPWEEREDGEYDDWMTHLEQIRIGMTLDNVWKLATQLASPVRQILGRPLFSYGVTPLVIFREIER